MFGWINDCTESLIVTKFGVDKWHEVKAKAGCGVVDDGFVRHRIYSDESTVSLVVAASEVLGISVDDVLEAFGQHFMEFTRRSGYDNLLFCQGSTLRLWLSNLNALHDHLQSSLPKGFRAPVFWCEDDDTTGYEGCILLHYFSERGCLLVQLVVGVVKEVSRYHFNVEVSMERLQTQTHDGAKFTTWRVSAVDPTLQWKLTKSSEDGETIEAKKEGTKIDESVVSDKHPTGVCPFEAMSQEMRKEKQNDSSDCGGDNLKESQEKDDNMSSDKSRSQCSFHQQETSISMSGCKMKEVFPYHIVVDQEFHIIQFGKKLPCLIGKSMILNRHIEDYLEIKRPVLGSWDWAVLHKLEDQTFFLESMCNSGTKLAKLKANIVHLSSDPKQVMFVISPDVKNVAELHSMRLTMSDLPLHSFQRDAVFLGEHMYSEVRSAHKLDKLSKKLFNERNLSNTLLYSMLPKDVAELLRTGKTFEPQHHENVTLFFSDVVGFTEMSAELAPWEVIDMLNTLYTLMDYLAAKFNLYKVETIGDAYMCCSGLPKEDEKHAENVANFALSVKRCVSLVKSPLTGQPIRLRMGMHTGNCMSGVVGSLTPHYCLFGDMINTTSRHESTCEPDKVQASSITFGRLTHFSEDSDHYNWTPRGLVNMKGKGKMFTYWLDSGSESNPFVGPGPMEKLVKEVEEFLATKTWKKRSYFVQRRTSSAASTTFTTLEGGNYQLMVNDDEVPDFQDQD
jgi:guanylate cyclase soluble subunit beta